ncbi:MAG: hypothetical protein ACOYW8_09175 [Bacillota bacterium]
MGDYYIALENLKRRCLIESVTASIDEMCEEARKHGALGDKITGAGGGGYVLFYCLFERKHKVAEVLKKIGSTITEFAFEFHGLQTWRVNND